MRTGGLKGLTGLVVSLVLSSSIVLPLAAVALPPPVPPYMSPPEIAVPSSTTGPTVGADAGGALADVLALRPPSGVDVVTGVGGDVESAIPDVVLAAYRNAARSAPSIAPGCLMDWAVLAGIGRVESRHGLHFGVDTVIDTQGTVRKPIIGPALDGTGGVSSIADSDGGQWDGDTTWDRAVGPMQFIPSSWRRYGQDGNRDGVRDPHNVFDATLAAAAHLCGTAAVDLRDDDNLDRALFSYNRSDEYVQTVRTWIDLYRATDPTDVPRVAVRIEAPSGPVSPFPAPDGRLAGVLGTGTPLFPPLIAGRQHTTPSPSRPAVASTPVPKASDSNAVDRTNKGPGIAAKAPGPSGDDKTDASAASPSKGSDSKDSKPTPGASATPSPKPSEGKAPTKPASEAPSSAPADAGSEPSSEPSEDGSGTPSSTPSEGGSDTPPPTPDAPAPEPPAQDPEPDPDPAPPPAADPDPAPEPKPAPEPEPAPAPEPEPDAAPAPEPEPEPTVTPVDFSTRPTVTYRGSTASDWPKACRPRALWAGVVDDAVADHIIVARGVAQAAPGDALTVTWRTARDTVWRVTIHGCESGTVT